MDWTSIIEKEYEHLKIWKENRINQIWLENQSAAGITNQSKETNCATWDTESDANTSNLTVRDMDNVFMLPALTPSPPMTTWLRISRNFPTTDFEGLDGTPHDDNNVCGGKFESIDDEMFIRLVRRMVPYQNSAASAISQTQVVEEVPDVSIFKSIGSYFYGNYTADKYVKLTKCHTQSCTPNIDEPMAAQIQPHQSLRAYRKYFCRQCFVYNCRLHPRTEHIDETLLIRKNTVDELEPFTEPCSDCCYLTKTMGNKTPYLNEVSSKTYDSVFKDFINNKAEKTTQTSRSPDIQRVETDVADEETTDPESEWSPGDFSLFLVLFNVFPYNCCAIAKTMRKSCEHVYKKMTSMEPPARNKAKPSRTVRRSKFHGNLQDHLTQTCTPCNHKGPCDDTTKCMCRNCEKYCSCGPNCKKRIPKCLCKGPCTTQKCICYCGQRECDPECKCYTCKNMDMQMGRVKHVQVAPSSIHGWGVMAAERCHKGDFISEYKGEIISMKECERREILFDRTKHCSYMFSLNGDSVIDARFFGNELRFLNYSDKPNCYCRVMLANGDHRVGVYAARNIDAGEELTIDYLTYDPTQ